MPAPRQIIEAKQLVVEGRDTEAFFAAFLNHIGITGVQIQDFGGIAELPVFLELLCNTPGFRAQVTSLGIVRDAETNAKAAFQSICGALDGAGLPVPARPLVPVGHSPRVGILILPDATTPGMLETVLLRAVADDPAMECVDQYFRCVEQQTGSRPGNMPKAQLQAFLASRPRPGLLTGYAARAGYLCLDSSAYGHVRQFLQAL
jgi:hypothetical protein